MTSPYCAPCDCVPVQGSQRVVPQFGPILALPFTEAFGALAREDAPRGIRVFEFDWTSIIPGLTGVLTVQNDLSMGLAARTRFSGGLLTGNTTSCTTFSLAFSRPVQLRRLGLLDFDGSASEVAHSFSPRIDGFTANMNSPTATALGAVGARCRPQVTDSQVVRGNADGTNGAVLWNARQTRNVAWTVWHRNFLSTIFPNVEVQAPLPARAAVRLACQDCDDGGVQAQNVPWTMDPASALGGGFFSRATKVVNGVTITGEVTNLATLSGGFSQSVPAGAASPNALTVVTTQRPSGPSVAEVSFTSSVEQAQVQVRVIDLDLANVERVHFLAPNHYPPRRADIETPVVVPGGNPGGVVWVADPGGGGYYQAPGGSAERSADLLWEATPWGPTQPVRSAFWSSPGANRASQWDFSGPIFTDADCGTFWVWADDGGRLSPDEVAALVEDNDTEGT